MARLWSLVLADTQQLQDERPQRAGTRPVALGELRAGGIDFAAAVISELELNGLHDRARVRARVAARA